MYMWLTWQIPIRDEGPHLVYQDTGGTILPISLTPGVYTPVAPDGTGGMSTTATGTLAAARKDHRSAAGISEALADDSYTGTPVWWHSCRLYWDGTGTLSLTASGDKDVIRMALGWPGTSDTWSAMTLGDQVWPVWAYQGGVQYTVTPEGWAHWDEVRAVAYDGAVSTMAGTRRAVSEITFRLVPREHITGTHDIIALSEVYRPDLMLPGGYLVMGEDSITAIYTHQGLVISLTGDAIRQSVQGWGGLYDVTVTLSGVQEVS